MKKDTALRDLRKVISPYAVPHDPSGYFQAVTTFALFLATLFLMYLASSVHYAFALPLALPAGFLLVRLFVLQHDCGHNSFFRSKAANLWLGRFFALFTLTPFSYWKRMHRNHHDHTGQLDAERDDGFFWLYTKEEFKAQSPTVRFFYRMYHHPLSLFAIGPLLYFGVMYRLWWFGKTKEDRESMLVTNIAIALVLAVLSMTIGLWVVFIVYLPVLAVATTVGTWFFYVQHVFEKAYWAHEGEWDEGRAIIEGSSFYDVSPVARWLSANIIYHPLHHLNRGIPNYKLRACWDKSKEYFARSPRFTFAESLRLIGFSLWDEANLRMIRFSDLKQ